MTRRSVLVTAAIAGLVGLLIPVLIGLRGTRTTTGPTLPHVESSLAATLDGRPDDGLERHVVAVEADWQPTTGTERDLLDSDGAAAYDALADAGLAPDVRDRDLAPRAGTAHPLAGLAGVHAVTPLGDGRYAVAAAPGTDLASVDGIAVVERDVLLSAAAEDAFFPLQWGLANTGQPISGTEGAEGVDVRWASAAEVATGSGVVVAVIDSGVDVTHPDLAGAIWHNADEVCGNDLDDDGNGYVDDCEGWDFVNDDPTVRDERTATGAPVDDSHGTHVAGIVAARAGNGDGVAGVAPDAEVMVLKVIENGTFPASRAARAIHYAIDNGADVINASWGAAPGALIPTVLVEAFDRAATEGVLVVVAAGNDGIDIDATPVYPAALGHPNIVSVGANTNADTVAAFSNVGVTSVDIFAPGKDIASTVPGGYAYMSGTSMAAPYVSGVAALVAQHRGTSDAAELVRAILGTTRDALAYDAYSVTGGRLAADLALSVAPGATAVEFAGLDAWEAGADRTARFTLTATELPEGDLFLQVTLGHLYRGEVHGVLDHPVGVGTPTEAFEATTGSQARVPMSQAPAPLTADERALILGPGYQGAVRMALPQGRYALLVELVDATGATVEIPYAGLWEVRGKDEPAPTDDAAPAPSGPSEPAPSEPAPAPAPTSPVPAPAPSDAPLAPQPEPSTAPIAPPAAAPAPAPSPSEPATPEPGPTASPPPAPAPAPSPTTDEPAPPVTAPAPAPTTPEPAPDPSPSEPSPVEPAPGEPAPAPAATPEGEAPAAPRLLTVWPVEGPEDGGTHVRISGALPEDVVGVTFGGRPAVLLARTASEQVVETPRHVPATVDVIVHARDGSTITIPAAFTFLAAGEPVTTPGPDPTTAPAPAPTAAPSEPLAPPAPAPSEPTDDPTRRPHDPTNDSGAGGDGETTPQGGVGIRDEAPGVERGTVGLPLTAPNGLTVDRLKRDEPLLLLRSGAWAWKQCNEPTCAGVPLGG